MLTGVITHVTAHVTVPIPLLLPLPYRTVSYHISCNITSGKLTFTQGGPEGAGGAAELWCMLLSVVAANPQRKNLHEISVSQPRLLLAPLLTLPREEGVEGLQQLVTRLQVTAATGAVERGRARSADLGVP